MKKGSIEKALIEGRFSESAYQRIKSFFKKVFKGVYRKKLFRRIDYWLAQPARRRAAQREPINKRKIVLMTTRGSYNCNPRAIADEIIRQKLPWELVWVARSENLNDLEQYPSQLRLVQRDSYEFYREAAQAKVIIDNAMSYAFSGAYKKEEQIFCQTWHGSIGLKRFETSSEKRWIRQATRSGKMTDYCFSNSTFETDLFNNTFWKTATILETGHARNDILLTQDKARIAEIRVRVMENLKIPEGVKIALYAPTFRDNKKDMRPYAINYGRVKNALETRFGGEWVILSRLHFEIKNTLENKRIKYPDCVINATYYPDIQDLLLVADVGITDYSSWICDFVLTRRPGFLFATDMQDYYSERGFYFPLESTPFPLAESNAEMEENILSFDETAYQTRCEEFIRDKGCVDDGHAAERIVEKLKEIMEEAE